MADTDPVMPRILVAEDSAAIRQILTYLLQARGYEVREAADGRAALELAAAHAFDLVILDVLMPHVNGLEVCARLRGSEKTKDIPILILTAVAKGTGKADEHWRQVSGADEFVSKPFKATDVLDRVERLLAARAAAVLRGPAAPAACAVPDGRLARAAGD